MSHLETMSCHNDRSDVSNRNIDSECLEGIRQALRIAMLTDQIVEVGLNCHGEPEVIVCRVIDVSRRTFCAILEDSSTSSDSRDSRDSRDGRDSRDSRDGRENRGWRNNRGTCDNRSRRDKREFDIADVEYVKFC